MVFEGCQSGLLGILETNAGPATISIDEDYASLFKGHSNIAKGAFVRASGPPLKIY